jgi:hypothetical protein
MYGNGKVYNRKTAKIGKEKEGDFIVEKRKCCALKFFFD